MDPRDFMMIYRNIKRPLIAEIPSTSPTQSATEQARLTIMVWRSSKRPLVSIWPQG